jgi:hypothetical protein
MCIIYDICDRWWYMICDRGVHLSQKGQQQGLYISHLYSQMEVYMEHRH